MADTAQAAYLHDAIVGALRELHESAAGFASEDPRHLAAVIALQEAEIRELQQQLTTERIDAQFGRVMARLIKEYQEEA